MEDFQKFKPSEQPLLMLEGICKYSVYTFEDYKPFYTHKLHRYTMEFLNITLYLMCIRYYLIKHKML